VIDHSASDLTFIKKAKELFRKYYDRNRKIRLIGVKLSQLDTDVMQMSLFENTAEDKNLFSAIDDIKQQFGKQMLFRAGSQNTEADRKKKPTDPLWVNRNAKPKDD
jgi:DNA polymerase IV